MFVILYMSCMLLYYILLRYIILYCNILYCIISYYIILYYIISYTFMICIMCYIYTYNTCVCVFIMFQQVSSLLFFQSPLQLIQLLLLSLHLAIELPLREGRAFRWPEWMAGSAMFLWNAKYGKDFTEISEIFYLKSPGKKLSAWKTKTSSWIVGDCHPASVLIFYP